MKPNIPHGVEYELEKFYYDVAQVAHPAALAALAQVAPVSRILFGTDFPYRTSADHVKGVHDFFPPRRSAGRSSVITRSP